MTACGRRSHWVDRQSRIDPGHRPVGRRVGAIAAVIVGSLSLLAGCVPAGSDGTGIFHQVNGIPSDRTIQPTAIVLHWWGSTSASRIQSLISGLLGQTGYYAPNITKAQYDANVASGRNGHPLGVQAAVTQDGTVYQLTPQLNSYAAHAACANDWAVGIEIEGAGAADLHGDQAQFESVVSATAALMRRYGIPLDGALAGDGRSGAGVHSHKEVDRNCRFADGVYAGQGKQDVDDAYLAMVKAELRRRGLG